MVPAHVSPHTTLKGLRFPCDFDCFFSDMGGCQNYGPFLGTLNIRCRIIIGTQKGAIILTTTHIFSIKYIRKYWL